MIISQILALSKNGVIGHDYKMLWHMPSDFKYFKQKTLGHYILMGRKTFESLGKPLPGRPHIIVTRSKDFKYEGCIVVDSIEKGIEVARKAGEKELFIIGGGEIYKQTLPLTDLIYLTEIDVEVTGNVTYPYPDKKQWEDISRNDLPADEKNPYNYSFTVWRKRN